MDKNSRIVKHEDVVFADVMQKQQN